MPQRSSLRRWGFGPLIVLLLAGLPCVAAAPASQTPEQRKETLDLVARFTQAKGDAEARKAIVDRILELGGPAPAKLLATVNAEIRPLYPRYRQAYLDAAARALAQRLQTAGAPEIEVLRMKVLALVSETAPTKDEIVRVADPARQRLEAILLTDRQALLEANATLGKQRSELEALAVHWQRLTDAVAAGTQATAEDAALRPPTMTALIEGDEDLAALLVLAKNEAGRKVLLDNLAAEAKLDPEEVAGLRRQNRILLILGERPMKIDLALCEAGRGHSKDMATLGFFDHTSPVVGKSTPMDRARLAGTSADAENIHQGMGSGVEAVEGWGHRPGHFVNMLTPHQRIGLGRYKELWTEMFGD